MVVMACEQYGLSPFVSWQRSWKENLFSTNKHTIIINWVPRHLIEFIIPRLLHWCCWVIFWLPWRATGNHYIFCLYYIMLKILILITMFLVFIEQVTPVFKVIVTRFSETKIDWQLQKLVPLRGHLAKDNYKMLDAEYVLKNSLLL